jgi:hypothetical protein
MIYVGKAEGNGGLFSRLNSHKVSRTKGGRWNQFSWFGIYKTQDNNQLDTSSKEVTAKNEGIVKSLEALLIAASEPRLNRQRGIWGEAVRYYQSKENYQTDREKLDKIQRSLDDLRGKNK